MLSSNRSKSDHKMGDNAHIEYQTPFNLSDLRPVTSDFQFNRGDVRETYISPDALYNEALRKCEIGCDDFLLVDGTFDNPERILLINRADNPLAGALWPLGGRSGNCANENLRMAELWRSNPLQASLLLNIFRESNLQPSDLSLTAKIVTFRVAFQKQNCSEDEIFNEIHPAVLHAVWIKPEAKSKLNFKEAFVNNNHWYTRDDILTLEADSAILSHVSRAAMAIFEHPESVYYDNPLLNTRLFA